MDYVKWVLCNRGVTHPQVSVGDGLQFWTVALKKKKLKLPGLSTRTNYTDLATAVCRRS
jgi:hypothetical protein